MASLSLSERIHQLEVACDMHPTPGEDPERRIGAVELAAMHLQRAASAAVSEMQARAMAKAEAKATAKAKKKGKKKGKKSSGGTYINIELGPATGYATDRSCAMVRKTTR